MDGAAAPLPDGRAVAITVVRGPDAGAKFEISTARIVIGRKRGDVIVKDRETSSLHASIELAPDGRFILKDLGSTNGTWLEGRRVTVAEIHPGQHLKVGANHLLFSVVDSASEATRQGRLDPSSDLSFPSPWTGGSPPPAAAPPPSAAPARVAPGPLDVDLGLPALGGGPATGPFPTMPEPLELPPIGSLAAPPVPAASPAPSSSAWPSPPPAPPAPWPSAPPPAPALPHAPAPVASAPPAATPAPAVPAAPSAAPSSPGGLPPLPELPAWPAPPVAPSERSTAVSPARAVDAAPPPRGAEPPATPLPASFERSVYGVYLVVERGRDRGRAFPINRQVTVLGRSGTEILINDPDISRRHAALDVQGEGKYVLRDLNSTNGTLLNGVGVQSQSIAPNDKIRMGSTTIKLVVGDDRVAAELARLAAEAPPA